VEAIGPPEEESLLEESKSEAAESSAEEEEEQVEISIEPEEPVPLPVLSPQPVPELPQKEPEPPIIDPVPLPAIEPEPLAIEPIPSPEPTSTAVILSPSTKPLPEEVPAEASKIIALPTKSTSPSKAKTTQMARQSRSMADVKIKTLDQIKKEKEDQKERPVVSPVTTPSKVTMMPRVTRSQGVKAKPQEIPQEPTPIKKAKLSDELPPIVEEMKEPEAGPLDSSQQDAHMELLYEEIDDIIMAEFKQSDSIPVPPPAVPIVEQASLPVVEQQEAVPEPPQAVFSPGALLAPNEIESGEVIEPPAIEIVPPIEQIKPDSIVQSQPLPPLPMPEAPQIMPEAPQIKEKPKPQPQPSASRKTVISLPSAPKPKGTGEILTLEQIKERKKLKAAEESAKAEASKSLPTPQPLSAPILQPAPAQSLPLSQPAQSTPLPQPTPPQSLKRPRDPEPPLKEASDLLKKPKPQPKPSPALIPPQILGDWEPISLAFKSLDFSISQDTSEEDRAGMQALAQRMSTPNGFLEILEELEERVTEMEVAKGLSPAIDPEFLVLSLEDQINWLYEHTAEH
jgi:hypothetical protein